MGEINTTLPVSVTGDVVVPASTVTATLGSNMGIKWIDGATEPAAPAGFERLPPLDLEIPIRVLDTTVTVKLWAFKAT